ncbi:glycosyltransferase family 2 protein [Cypionkella sp.]|uniref:glycosyltransferase family 2 protein n=1 Tax=Cypionkella sp. TaxID=2811411 RepID=UPI002ABC3C86|nr:glycosyltransferase family 2 protein [Cypionkella sp.]MDZ4394643.1 glycosyltransferase family 2 protein [Cypionkella sp.]
MKPNWAVVATVDEPAALVATFAAHHLAQGAAAVHVFLDQPDVEAQAMLARLPGCVVTVCDAAYWASTPRGKRPGLHTTRQAHNARRVYAQTDADWLLHCDADEFLRDGDALRAELAAAPVHAMYLRLLVAERAYPQGIIGDDIFTGVFRHELVDYPRNGARVYGEMRSFFHYGLTGHKAGKAVVRVGAQMQMGIHAPLGKPPHQAIQSTRLLHFDGLTPLHFTLKLLRRAHEPPSRASDRHGAARSTQFWSLCEAVADAPLRTALVSTLKTLDHRQIKQLRRFGCLDETGFDPRPVLAAAGLDPDLSVAAFDTCLRQRYAGFLQMHAPDLA